MRQDPSSVIGEMKRTGPRTPKVANRELAGILLKAKAGTAATLAAVLVAVGLAGGTDTAARSGSRNLRQLRFSWDGRYILAQDDSEIAVFTAHPLAILFRISTDDATDAQFTPDSTQVVFVRPITRVSPDRIAFVNSPPHVERWDVGAGARSASAQIPMLGCGTVGLSPDGHTLACEDFEGTLRILDVPSGDIVLEKKQFVKLVPIYSVNPIYGNQELPNGHFLGDLGQAGFHFSPGGRLFVARPDGAGKVLAWDVQQRQPAKLPGALGRIRNMDSTFGFVSADRVLVAYEFEAPATVRARLVAIPSGKVLSRPRIPRGGFRTAADPHFAIIRPFGKYARYNDPNPRAAAVEIATGEVIISETRALDVFGRYYVAEPSPGVVGLYERGKGLQATIPLHSK